MMSEIAWRFWEVIDGNRLISPVSRMVLPVPDAVYAPPCEYHPNPPAAGCDCGVCYWPARRDMQAAVDKLDLMWDHPFHDIAITVGVAEGRILPDECPPKWADRIAGVAQSINILPPARRCTTYRVTAILTPRRSPFPFNVPIVRGTSLDLLADVL